MMKRTILGVLMLVVGLVIASSIEGLLIGLPLVALGLYTFVPALARGHARLTPRLSVR